MSISKTSVATQGVLLSPSAPRDQVTHACGYLNTRELTRVACCSKFLNGIAQQEMLWKPLLKARFNSELIGARALYRTLAETELNKRRGNFTQQDSFPHQGDQLGAGIALHKGRLITMLSSDDFCIKIWDRSAQGYTASTLLKHDDGLGERLAVDEGRCIVAGLTEIRVWDAQNGNRVAQMPYDLGAHEISITALLPLSKGLVSGCTRGSLTIWSDEYTPIANFRPGLGKVESLAQANNTLFAGFKNGHIRTYDLSTHLPLKDYPAYAKAEWSVRDLKIHENTLVSSSDNVIIWNIRGSALTRRSELQDPQREVCGKPDARFLAIDATDKQKPILYTCSVIEGLIGIWDLNSGTLFSKINTQTEQLTYFACDGTRLVTFGGYEKFVRIRSFATPQSVAALSKQESKEGKTQE